MVREKIVYWRNTMVQYIGHTPVCIEITRGRSPKPGETFSPEPKISRYTPDASRFSTLLKLVSQMSNHEVKFPKNENKPAFVYKFGHEILKEVLLVW